MPDCVKLGNENLDVEELALKSPLPEETEEELMDMETLSEVNDDNGNIMEHENSSHMKDRRLVCLCQI